MKTIRFFCVLLIALTFFSACKTTGRLNKNNSVYFSEAPTTVNVFLDVLKKDIEGHNWEGFIRKCDPKNYQLQVVKHGISKPQYITEMLSVPFYGTVVEEGKNIEYRHLNKIRAVEYEKYSKNGSIVNIDGKIILNDKTKLDMSIKILTKGGSYYLLGGVG